MAIRKIAFVGHPVLRQRAREVSREELATPAMQQFIDDLIETMRHAKGAGLAANQVAEPVRICAIEVGDNPRYPGREQIPFTVLINPQLTPVTDEQVDDWEGCLSVPGMRGLVPRFPRLRYRGFDQFGAHIDRTVGGFHARVVQHEVDHLDGILYPMRIRDMSKFGFTEVLFPELAGMDDD